MEKLFKMTLVVLAVCASSFLGIYFGMKTSNQTVSFGGVNQSNDYFSTTTDSGTAAAVYYVKTTPGAVGEITVASSSRSTFTVLDTNGLATTTVATLKAGVSEGTFQLNRSFIYGVGIQVPSGFNGQYITTYR